ncbi:MAG: STAS domain-containing protein [Gammaproteobacteria bacterium]|nr:STAS domain-containing protein [Gammaproteobacteria bacterium]MCY4218338.1 STAS domain-containing protein [Gammaproteobacteria bacterium]MCY4274030.1 STAS domain-containing protein [Gammaproteobacteria bacterium]
MLELEQEQNAYILKVSGRIDGSNAAEFQSKIQDSIPQEASTVILDLNDLDYISSAGLRVILLLAKNLKGKKGKLSMCSVSGPVKDVFTISGFSAIIPTYDNRESALSASD